MAEAKINEFCLMSVILKSIHMMEKLRTRNFWNIKTTDLYEVNKKPLVQIRNSCIENVLLWHVRFSSSPRAISYSSY